MRPIDLRANIAYLHNALGRPDSAVAYYQRALPELVDSAGLLVATRQYGEVYHAQGILDSALIDPDDVNEQPDSLLEAARALASEAAALRKAQG